MYDLDITHDKWHDGTSGLLQLPTNMAAFCDN